MSLNNNNMIALNISHFEKLFERIILDLGDEFNIRFEWDTNTGVITSICALVGGLIGGYKLGKIGAAVGAGISGATAYAAYTIVTLREAWRYVKDQLKELLYIVFNYLQKLSPYDYIQAYRILRLCQTSRWELAMYIIDVMGERLGRVIHYNHMHS